MKPKRIAVVTSKGSWFRPFAKDLVKQLKASGISAVLYSDHKKVTGNNDVVFLLSYFHIVSAKWLKQCKYNLVVHESDLPKGRGWAPMFWQVIEGKSRIPIVLFEANAGTDSGPVYLKDTIRLDGTELHDELREKQAKKTNELCLKFVKKFGKITAKPQVGRSTYYKKRTAKDSELKLNKTIKEQINLLRTVNNEDFPAFFIYKKKKYFLQIHSDKDML